jgi:16S rRNA G527 N7-methylase RsmG
MGFEYFDTLLNYQELMLEKAQSGKMSYQKGMAMLDKIEEWENVHKNNLFGCEKVFSKRVENLA